MNNLDKFETFIFETLKTTFTDSEEYETALAFVVQSLSKSSPKLEGQVFYSILIHLDLNIDKTCKEYFKNSEARTLDSLECSDNLFRNLISPYINSQNHISNNSDILGKRFNRLFSGELTELYAHEVYNLSITLNTKPSQLFEYFYGGGERPLISLVPPAKINN